MTETKFTPGPWKVDYDDFGLNEDIKWPNTIRRPHDTEIDTIVALVGGNLWAAGEDDMDYDVACADARLIAAAPEMFEALKMAQVALNTIPLYKRNGVDSYKIAARIDAVLAKAKGENQ